MMATLAYGSEKMESEKSMTVVSATDFGVVLMCLMSESLHRLGFGVFGRIKAQRYSKNGHQFTWVDLNDILKCCANQRLIQ